MVLCIGVIGAGSVGTSLGGRLLLKGHKVVYGVRDPTSEKAKQVIESQPAAKVHLVDSASMMSDVIILAVPGFRDQEAAETVAKSLGHGAKDKVVIDATNPLTGWPSLEVLWDKPQTSGGELLAAALPDSFVYKAFNTLGAELMQDPTMLGQKMTLLFAGPSEKSDLASTVIEDVGFTPSYVGPIRFARNLEAIAELWIHLGVPGLSAGAETWGRNFHFQVIKK